MNVSRKRISKYGQLIAVTGGIGTGKSFILRCFKLLGFRTYSLDQLVAEMYKKGGAAYEAVALAFPDCANNVEINKALLSARVFAKEEDLKRLEAIVHPILRQEFHKFINRAKRISKLSIVVEVPLLFESSYPYDFDMIISGIANRATQIKRVLQRKNMTTEKFNAIVRRQTADTHRLLHSDMVVFTELHGLHTFKQIKLLVYGKYKRSSTRY